MLAKRRRFTIVELLVVIVIIMILAGILLAALTGVMKSGEKAQTQGAIDAIAIGIEKYRDAKGYYPAMDGTTGVAASLETRNLYSQICSSTEPFCSVPSAFINNSNPNAPYFIDIWERPIRYITAEYYPAPGGASLSGNALKNGQGLFYNFTSYQIRSLGKDGVDNNGSGDDVQNFAK